ncbi:MAG TPA: FixH family protein [Bacillales bacterium]
MKKILPIFMALALALAACSTSADSNGMPDDLKQKSEEMIQDSSDKDKMKEEPKHHENMESEEGHHHEGEGHHHHHAGVSFDLNKTMAKANQRTEIKVSLEKDGEALSNALVRYEYWMEGGKRKHYYTDKKKTGEQGSYTATVTFPSTGTYHFKVHVYKGDHLHTHKLFNFLVK